MSTGQFAKNYLDKDTAINLTKLLSSDKDYSPPTVNTKRKVQKVKFRIPKRVGKKSKVKLG